MKAAMSFMCGVKQQRAGYRFTTDHYDHFQVIVVRSGQLCAEFGTGTVDFGPNTLLILPPKSTFELWCEGSGYRGIGVNAAEWPGQPPRAIGVPCDRGVRQLSGLIEGALVRAEPGSRQMVYHLGAALCELAVRHPVLRADGQDTDRSEYWAERVMQAIENHLQSDLCIGEILGGLGLCYRQLARHFEAQFGISPKRYQMIRRVEEARRLLAATDMPVTAIALELGFGSSQHFASRFRQVTGQSATAVRDGKKW